MSRRRSRARTLRSAFFAPRAPAPNMTPMVDVVMVILVFYMASASLAGLELFKTVAVPRVGAGEGAAEGDPFALPPVLFTLRLTWDGGATAYDGLGDGGGAIASLGPVLSGLVRDVGGGGLEVLIQPDVNVPYQDVILVCDECSEAGVTKMGLLPSP